MVLVKHIYVVHILRSSLLHFEQKIRTMSFHDIVHPNHITVRWVNTHTRWTTGMNGIYPSVLCGWSGVDEAVSGCWCWSWSGCSEWWDCGLGLGVHVHGSSPVLGWHLVWRGGRDGPSFAMSRASSWVDLVVNDEPSKWSTFVCSVSTTNAQISLSQNRLSSVNTHLHNLIAFLNNIK